MSVLKKLLLNTVLLMFSIPSLNISEWERPTAHWTRVLSFTSEQAISLQTDGQSGI